MKIVVLSDLWPPFPGGAERLQFNLARDLMRRGHEIEVLTGYEDALQLDGPPVTAAPIGVFATRDDGARIVSGFIADTRPDVILTHHLYANQFTPELEASGIPFVHVVLNGARIPSAALGVYISNWVRKHAFRPAAYKAVPDWARTDLTITPPAFDDIIAETHGDAIGFIKPIPHKGIETVYQIAAALPDRRFVILRGEWQDLEVIRPAANIEFLDPVVDIRDFYTRVRLVLMPSVSEDAGTVAQEAALNRIPCLSSDVQGLAQTNQGGVLLPPGDAAGYVAAIQRLDDPSEYAHVVERQAAAFAATDQTTRLDEFAARIEALVDA